MKYRKSTLFPVWQARYICPPCAARPKVHVTTGHNLEMLKSLDELNLHNVKTSLTKLFSKCIKSHITVRAIFQCAKMYNTVRIKGFFHQRMPVQNFHTDPESNQYQNQYGKNENQNDIIICTRTIQTAFYNFSFFFRSMIGVLLGYKTPPDCCP
jgi:hypothetical protein